MNKTGAQRITDERDRQIEAERYNAAHDDKHNNMGELARAATCYAAAGAELAIYMVKRTDSDCFVFADPWPWDSEWDKREDYMNHGGVDGMGSAESFLVSERIDLLAKAGALCAAQIDLLQRRQEREEEQADA